MFEQSFTERIIHRVDLETRRIRAPYHRKKLNNTDFSIISNNCWGGVLYEYYGLPKLSPTVGSYWFAQDYLRFLSRFDYYINKEIHIISAQESSHKEELITRGENNIPIGILDDGVEIVFLHYKDPEVAREKWNRRIERINYNNLIFKFSEMNQCSEELLKKFDSMDLPGKRFFFVRKMDDVDKYKNALYYPGYDEDIEILNDTYYFNKYINVPELINNGLLIAR